MKAAGIITEYNPFHNGHSYHINQTRKITGCDAVICVMSGNYTQRGEPAVILKQARTKAALLNGVDLVIELPFVYACQSAEFFAYGAVRLLDSLGIIDCLCFGSEYDNIPDLSTVAQILTDEPHEFKTFLKNFLKEGLSFPAARQKAIAKYIFNNINKKEFDINKILNSSNSILAVEYLKALYKLNSTIKAFAVKRIGADYKTKKISKTFSSAMAIRKLIYDKRDSAQLIENLKNVMPDSSAQILIDEIKSERAPVFSNGFDNIITAHLRRSSPQIIKSFPFVSEGLQNRLHNSAKTNSTFNGLVKDTATRRYPATRIQRLLIHIITGLTGSFLSYIHDKGGPQYIRILGFNKKGEALLSDIKKRSYLPVISSYAEIKNLNNPAAEKLFEFENISTDIYSLLMPDKNLRISGNEFKYQLVKI